MRPLQKTLVSLAIVCATALTASAESKQNAQIAWFGTWKQGLAQAKRSGRPILLVSAAPHCRNVPGIW